MNTPLLVGIDPGVNGAIAAVRGSAVHAWDMPTLAAGTKKGRRIIDGPKLIGYFQILAARAKAFGVPISAVLEEVSSQPRDGHVGAFSFGRTYGITETALAAAGIPFRTVRPQVWKKAMGVTSDKDFARQRATQLLPAGTELFARAKDDGRAEAALIALYGMKI